MSKKPRLGSDPLSWIKDSRKKTKDSKQSLHSIQSKRNTQSKSKTTKQGLKEGWARATFIVREDYIDKLKAVAYWDRKQIKEVINEALTAYLKGKKIKRTP